MKKLVYAAVLATAFAAGCVVEENPVIIADITLDSAGPGTITYQAGDGLRVNARLTGTQSGFQDIYNPDVRALITPELTTGYGEYDLWVDYINDARGEVVVVDETNIVTVLVEADLHVTADLLLGNGFMMANWSLSDAGGAPITSCSDIPGEGGVSILSTLTGPNTGYEDLFNCEDGFNDPNPVVTDPNPLGGYVVAISLLNSANPPLAIGAAPDENSAIIDGNDYVELGNQGLVDIQLF